MAEKKSVRAMDNALRAEVLGKLYEGLMLVFPDTDLTLTEDGYAVPVVREDGQERFVVIGSTLKVSTYDVEEAAENYELILKEREEKAANKAKSDAEKAARAEERAKKKAEKAAKVETPAPAAE